MALNSAHGPVEASPQQMRAALPPLHAAGAARPPPGALLASLGLSKLDVGGVLSGSGRMPGPELPPLVPPSPSECCPPSPSCPCSTAPSSPCSSISFPSSLSPACSPHSSPFPPAAFSFPAKGTLSAPPPSTVEALPAAAKKSARGFVRCTHFQRGAYENWTVHVVEADGGRKEVFGPPPERWHPLPTATHATIVAEAPAAARKSVKAFARCKPFQRGAYENWTVHVVDTEGGGRKEIFGPPQEQCHA
eukprot:TRINITY_DN5871_c0_g1_i1.p1 TRINITY_DN5871_c0_g1~~TRINITY_DN5871_c0_g1_i1.p1  ORF type:complete len:248 (+),score=53.58 TRINITY_DN5871_c0_g1_i1:598-1341(+)